MTAQDELTIFDFDDHDCTYWYSINDAVMGGVSRGALVKREDSIVAFVGSVSFENNGGFASVKSELSDYDLSAYKAIGLRVFGDGKKYKIRIKIKELTADFFYEATFIAKAQEWLEVEIPFDAFYVTRRGQVFKEAPKLNPKEIQSFGFLISDRQEGNFELRIDWIKALL